MHSLSPKDQLLELFLNSFFTEMDPFTAAFRLQACGLSSSAYSPRTTIAASPTKRHSPTQQTTAFFSAVESRED